MIRRLPLLLLALLLAVPAAAQIENHSLVVSDDAENSETLQFGLDPCATDDLDACVGESELPPLPPSGVFDARFTDDGSYDLGQRCRREAGAG